MVMQMVNVLNVPGLVVSEKQVLENMNKGVMYTPNVDHLCKLQKDNDFYDYLSDFC